MLVMVEYTFMFKINKIKNSGSERVARLTLPLTGGLRYDRFPGSIFSDILMVVNISWNPSA